MTWIGRSVADLRSLWLAANCYGVSKPTALAGFLSLALRGLYSPTEILRLGLLDPASLIRPERYMSSEALLAIQHRLNPYSHQHLTEDKISFYRKCLSADLPTPRILAIFGEGTYRYPDLKAIRSPGEFVSAASGHAGVVFKPVDGTHGHGVLVLSVEEDRFREHNGRSLDAAELIAHSQRCGAGTWLLQERLNPHAELARLSGHPLIQTVRLVTYIAPAGGVSLLWAWLRIVGGRTSVDNFAFGGNGNLVGSIDVSRGTLDHTLAIAPHGFGLVRKAQHPSTGVAFDGFAVPGFRAACEIVKRAAAAFLPLRTIGWDVAITDHGVSLIEGNVTWDPLPTYLDMAEIVRGLD